MSTSIKMNAYLAFENNCKEAMEFYQSILGGELEFWTFEDFQMEVPDEFKQNIMHSNLNYDSGTLMACDMKPGMPVTKGNAISLYLNIQDIDKAKLTFDKLADGGTVLMPLGKTSWNAIFGMCTDKYGFDWMVSTDLV